MVIHRLEGHLHLSMERLKEAIVRRTREHLVGIPEPPQPVVVAKWTPEGTGGFAADVVAVVAGEEVVEP